MASTGSKTIDGNEAAVSVAYRLTEVAAIYPITPSSTMGELADEWASEGRPNLWGSVPSIVEMQSEAGAAGAVHGALQAGALATTFTASQGLLLMIPDMYKIAGELTPFVMHVAARSIATHALSIFGDHSDVMACRQTGFAMLSSSTVQEAHDFALVAQAASLESRVPFLHFFDGFRTSHEVMKIAPLADEDLEALIDEAWIRAHRERALSPDRPVLRGTAQNPDTFFQAREAANRYYTACPGIVEGALARLAERTGRRYGLVDYFGHPQAERVLVLMGSAADTARETVEHLAARGEKVGALCVRLYRPFPAAQLLAALPPSTRAIAVLDRCKEPGALGEPLYLDVVTALREAEMAGASPFAAPPRVAGGRYGLSSKELTPAMLRAALANLERERPQHPFTLGIVDDVTHLSLEADEGFEVEAAEVKRAVFFGLGSDGTVGANKNSIKIIGEETPNHAQGYFVYDSKKSGAVTVSHLRFGPRPIRSHYLVKSAQFVACHQFNLLQQHEILELASPRATVLLNSPFGPAEVWEALPLEVQELLLEKDLRLFVIDASSVAEQAGMGQRINTIMQVAFFALSGVLPREEAIAAIQGSIERTYAKKGAEVVRSNLEAVDTALAHLHQVPLAGKRANGQPRPPAVSSSAPEFVQRVTAMMLAGKGDLLPVSAFPPDGTWPTGTARWEKRALADAIPIWDPAVCIQCNKCAFVCPHAAIRAKVFDPAELASAPAGFLSEEYKGREFEGARYTIQVAPEDCTGCRLCMVVCPAKDKGNPRRKAINPEPLRAVLERERASYDFFLGLPERSLDELPRLDVKSSQFLLPLFEYSGACAGCGETPYVKLLTQLFGDRALIANATGCSSIYGGNLPTTPYTVDAHGRGPAWSNSLFEDNAEFGLGLRLGIDALGGQARVLLAKLAGRLGEQRVAALLADEGNGAAAVRAQRERVAELRRALEGLEEPEAMRLAELADHLVPRSVWLVGGDGWAFDIGFGGLDHVLSLDRNVNVLVLDTEVYSNTGGQASKATPLGAVAKFAARGKAIDKKDMGLMAMSYGHVYVASVAFGAKDAQTLKAFVEAESYDGPSLVIAYSHCIAHGYDMAFGADQQGRAVASGIWPLYRYDPRRVERGEAPLVVDAPGGKLPVQEYMRGEARFRMVERLDPEAFKRNAKRAQLAAERRMALYKHLAELRFQTAATSGAPAPTPEPVAADSKQS